MGLRTVAILALLASCYDVPTPTCGFSCLDEGECPDGYSCNRDDGFCHLGGLTQTCPGHEGADREPPFVSLQPSSGTQIDAGTTFVASFDEEVTGVTTDSFFITVDGMDVKLDANVMSFQGHQSWQLEPSSPLPLDKSFTVTLTSDIEDLGHNSFSGATFHYFTQSPTPPMLLASTPFDSEENVSVGVMLQLFFDKAAPNILSVFHLDDPLGDPVAIVYDPSSDTQDPIFNLRWQLTGNTTYTAVIDPGLMDALGDTASTGTAFQFTTGPDNLGPRIFARMPGFFALNVPVSSGVSISFDEDALNVVDGSIVFTNGGVVVPGKVTYDSVNKSARFRPDNQLDGLTSYDVFVATSVTDAFGNSVLDGGWTFQTAEDLVPPQIRSTTPHTASTNVPVNTTIAMTFDEPATGLDATTVFVFADGVIITGMLVATDGNRTWTFTPDAPLPAMTVIDVEVDTAMDSFGNSANYFYSFTTAP